MRGISGDEYEILIHQTRGHLCAGPDWSGLGIPMARVDGLTARGLLAVPVKQPCCGRRYRLVTPAGRIAMLAFRAVHFGLDAVLT